MSDRLHAYRARRHGIVAADAQTALPFEAAASANLENADPAPVSDSAATLVRSPARPRRRTERVEISIPKHEIASSAADIRRPSAAQSGFAGALDALFPVAPLSERRRAAMLDIALLLFSYGGMLALFWALGGRIGFNKVDAIVTSSTLVLFYAQYFALFTVFGGSTPGMMVCRLRVVSFDGSTPSSGQMIWRSFGYLVSAGTCFLGFLWALWDEDDLCWQDRISQTYLTQIEGLAVTDSPARTAHG